MDGGVDFWMNRPINLQVPTPIWKALEAQHGPQQCARSRVAKGSATDGVKCLDLMEAMLEPELSQLVCKISETREEFNRRVNTLCVPPHYREEEAPPPTYAT